MNWLSLSIVSLLLGGLFSIVLILGRAPGINAIIGNPVFAKKCLVVHVTLTLSCWFIGNLAALCHLFPQKVFRPLFYRISTLGIVFLIIGAFSSDTTPVLSNYIPVIHGNLFLFGLSTFMFGVAASIVDVLFSKISSQTFSDEQLLDIGSAIGLKASAFLYILSILVFIGAFITSPFHQELKNYYELLFWGPGHILQMANIALLIVVWLILYKQMTGSALIEARVARTLFALIVVPTIATAALLYEGTTSLNYQFGFSLLMKWATWPSATIVLILMIHKVLNSEKPFEGKELEFTGIMSSALLLILGFLLGSQIRESNTLIPAHYHATTGAVILAFMCLSYILIQKSMPQNQSSFVSQWISKQPLIFGTGQFTFCIGFAYAGIHGLGRKTFGNEQLLHKTEQYIGLAVMGFGGLMALFGGALFFVLLSKMGYLKPPSKLINRILPFSNSKLR